MITKNKKGIIQNIVILIAILSVVFLSQQPNFKFIGKNISTYIAEGNTWAKTHTFAKMGGEGSTIFASVKDGVTTQKNNMVQNIWGNFKNYFAEKFSKTFGTKVQ